MDSVAIKDEALRILGMDLESGDRVRKMRHRFQVYTFIRYVLYNTGPQCARRLVYIVETRDRRGICKTLCPREIDRLYARIPRAIK